MSIIDIRFNNSPESGNPSIQLQDNPSSDAPRLPPESFQPLTTLGLEHVTGELDTVDASSSISRQDNITDSVDDDLTDEKVVMEFTALADMIAQMVEGFCGNPHCMSNTQYQDHSPEGRLCLIRGAIASHVYTDLFNLKDNAYKVFGFDQKVDLALGQVERQLLSDDQGKRLNEIGLIWLDPKSAVMMLTTAFSYFRLED